MRSLLKNRVLALMMGASFLVNLAFGLYRSVYSNFVGQELGISAGQFGWLEGIREVPGLVIVVLVAMLVRFRDERLYAVSIGMTGAGIWMFATAHSYPSLIMATLVQSTGFHLWSVMQDSLVIKSFDPVDRASRLGQVNSIAAAATLLGMATVGLSGSWFASLRPYFVISGVVGLAGLLVGWIIKPSTEHVRRPAFVFRWRYRSYYFLTLLQGARRHMVLTFAGFALVKLFNTPVSTMAVLLSLHSFLAIWTRPMIGKVIDRLGEQRALSLNYAVVAVVFAGYAFIRQPWVYYGLFILDNVLTGFDIAVSTHAGRIIPRAELSSSLATGTTINHIFGVSIPIVGGILWEMFDPKVPFLMGVAVVLIAMVYSWNLDKRTALALASQHAG